MILDNLENSNLYLTVHPRFAKAFDFLHNTDLLSLPIGKIELDNKNIMVIVSESNGKNVDDVLTESHNKYIDIQLPILGKEQMGWTSSIHLINVYQEYNSEKDIAFFTDKSTNIFTVLPYEFAIFFPGEGHQPGIGEGLIKKIIVKVLL